MACDNAGGIPAVWSTCRPPSSPLCFRKIVHGVIYCEWNMNTTESGVTYKLYFKPVNGYIRPFPDIKGTSYTLVKDQIVTLVPVDVWVEARVGNSSCQSNKTSVTLHHAVKYDAPEKATMSWDKGDLVLAWTQAEPHPALAEVRFRVFDRPSEPWANRLANTSSTNSKYKVRVEDLLEHTAYRVQIRHRSTQVLNPLWSDWSPVLDVPAALDQQPVVTIRTRVKNGTRQLTLTWKPMPAAASVGGVNYSVTDTQTSRSCPCRRPPPSTQQDHFTTHVSYSAVNISVTASNAAGSSPAAVAVVGPVPALDLKACNGTLLGKKLKSRNCLELYEFQDGGWRPAEVITSADSKNKNLTMKDYVYYLYFQHRCLKKKPSTEKMCVFYHKEGVPLTEPLDFKVLGELSSSINLSWKSIPIGNLRGFLSHYRLCTVQLNSEEKDGACYNISASVRAHRLENLTPGSKYNISLAAVTGAGEGPRVIRIINTLPENRRTVLPWVLGILIVLFLLSTLCTCMLRQIKEKICPPVPKPVILDFTHYKAENRKILERPEVVDELILFQLQPESKSVLEKAEETLFRGHWYEDTDKDMDTDRDRDSTHLGTSEDYGEEHCTDEALRNPGEGERTNLHNEIAILVYKNRLVFDMKMGSP